MELVARVRRYKRQRLVPDDEKTGRIKPPWNDGDMMLPLRNAWMKMLVLLSTTNTVMGRPAGRMGSASQTLCRRLNQQVMQIGKIWKSGPAMLNPLPVEKSEKMSC